jgi:hypothetical protein
MRAEGRASTGANDDGEASSTAGGPTARQRTAIALKIDPSTRRVTATAHGRVTLADLLDYFDTIAVQEAGPYAKLVDVREAQADLSDDDVMILGARASAYAAESPIGPAAVVVRPGSATAELAARYMNLARSGRHIEIFTSHDDAEQWLQAIAAEADRPAAGSDGRWPGESRHDSRGNRKSQRP